MTGHSAPIGFSTVGGRGGPGNVGPRPVRVLLVTHETSRTGAPRVALLAARSLIELGYAVHVVARSRGPLLGEFERIAPTSVEVMVKVRGRLWARRWLRVVAYLLDTFLTLMTLLWRRPDLVYINSTSASVYLRPARWLRRPVVLHVHESRQVAATFLRSARAGDLVAGVRLIACSPSVQTELAHQAGCAETDVILLPSVPDDRALERLSRQEPDRPYEADELVVGCCGAVEHRKGPDLWVAAARRVLECVPGRRVRFVWVGDIRDPSVVVSPPGIDFVGPSANPFAHMRRFDVATLPSRDDPFPLVVLESMHVGTPVVAFGVGGVPEQVGDAGVVVPPGDVGAFAHAVVGLLGDEEERRRLGRAAAVRATRLYSAETFKAALAEALGADVRRAAEPPPA